MKLYDGLIEETFAALGSLRPQHFAPGPSPQSGGRDELVLRRDAACELGMGASKSVSFLTVTENPGFVPASEILLYGPDLGKLRGDNPFARITIVLVDGVDSGGEQAAYNRIKDIELIKFGEAPLGCMVRPAALSLREEMRISSKAVAEGLDFSAIGSFYINNYMENRHVRAVRIIFITDPAAPFDEIERTGRVSSKITQALNHVLADAKMDCRACSWKPVCDEVEGMREAHRQTANANKESQ